MMIGLLFAVAGLVILVIVLHGFASGLGECRTHDARHRRAPFV